MNENDIVFEEKFLTPGRMTNEMVKNLPEQFENITRNEATDVEQFAGFVNYDVQRIRQQFTQTKFHFSNPFDHVFIVLSLVVTVGNMLRFPIICSQNGGLLFFIPYLLCIIFITMPIIYLENAIGQYSSLPSIKAFRHLCPAFQGIGIAMLLLAIFKTLLLSYSVLGIFYTFKSITTIFSSLSQTTLLECAYQSHSSCYDPYIKCNEAIGDLQYYSECYNFQSDQMKNANYTWEEVVLVTTSTSEALREFPPNIYWMEKIKKPGKISEFFIASAIIEQAIIATIAILGIRFYAKVAPFVVIFPQLCMLICIIYTIAQNGFKSAFASIAEGFSPDSQKIFDLEVWITALLQALIATNLLDGTYITLATMKDFRNNFMRDTFLIIIYEIIINLFGCFFLFSIGGVAAKIMFPMSTGKSCTSNILILTSYLVLMLWKHGENIYFIVLSLLFVKTSFGALIVSLTFFSLFLSTIGMQIITIEMIIMSVYQAVVRIKFIHETTSRNIIISIYFLFMHLWTFIHGRLNFGDIKVLYFHFAPLLSILAFLELFICIHIYHVKRLVVNLHTMLGNPPSNFWKYLGYPVNWYWTTCWYIITPALCILSGGIAIFIIMNGKLYSHTTVLTLITIIPLFAIIITMVIRIVKGYQIGKRLKSLFTADRHWTPELSTNREQAIYEERASRAII